MNRLKQLREERGFSIRSLEPVIGINHSTINVYENEKRDINTAALKKFAEFYEVTIDYLLCYSNYYIFVNYYNLMFKVNEDNYNDLVKKGYIYFNNENKRCVKLNELIGVHSDVDLSELVKDLYMTKCLNSLFDKDNVFLKDFENVRNCVEVVLDGEFVEYIKNAINA